VIGARTIAPKRALATAALVLLLANAAFAAAPGLDAYRNDNYADAYKEFEKTLKEHPNTHAADKIEFDAGTAAYKLKDYDKALEWFSRSLLSKDKTLQEKSHFNIGRTLEERADKAKTIEKALNELTNAQSHYEEALKLDPNDERAKANLEEVKKKIERLKEKQKEKPSPTPTPPQDQKKQDQKKQDQQKDQQQKDQQQQQQKDQNKDQNQQQQQQDQSKDQQKPDKGDDKKEQPKPGETPSPSPGDQQTQSGSSPSPSPDKGSGADQPKEEKSPGASPSPTAGDASPSPSPGEGEGPEGSPTATPGNSPSPAKKPSGELKGAGEDKQNQPAQGVEAAQEQPEKEGQMSEKQAQLLLQSMKDEEQRVQLDERKAARHVYNDW
jgi:Ca-activated chloride channel family protein